MRKRVKNNILEIFKTMYEAHEHIKGLIYKKDFENVQSLLADCQNTAVEIGTEIESSEGEGFVTVGFLEEYCEAVYEISISIADESNANKAQKRLDRKLLKAENSAKNDIKVKLEVVFLPYKASMWDSLESVWKAADEDEGCNAVVMPIPYFEINPDMTFGEMHYEGAEFPRYVPITDWQQYDLNVQRPDVIYIHNPYDNWNRVTSVHPMFYSSNLKKVTDELVYIPYFVLEETNPNNAAALKEIGHFVTTPGVLNADKVIVQSEDMKKAYVNILASRYGENNRAMFEKKILGTGSPKFDKVANTKKEDVEVPDEWLRVIQKPDGSWKKIIFYNTSLSAFLQSSDKYFDKMRDVFRVFKENADDVALLWRPHPLMESTIKSMRTDFYEEYMQLVEEYKNAGWGIYDDTADLDRAIAVSDAYYGDGSSVVQLFVKSHKYIMLQSADMTHCDENLCRISAYDYCVDGEDVWIVNQNLSLLMKYNMVTDVTEVIGIIPNVSLCIMYPFSSIQKVGNKIVLVPCRTDVFIIYDTESKQFFDVKCSICRKDTKNFRSVFAFEKYLYCIPCCAPNVIRLNIETLEIDYICEWRNLISGADSSSYLGEPALINENKCICVSIDSVDLLEINLVDGSYKAISTNLNNKGFRQVIYNSGNLFLHDNYKNEIVKYNLSDCMPIAVYDNIKADTYLYSVDEGVILNDYCFSDGYSVYDDDWNLIKQVTDNIEYRSEAVYYYGGLRYEGNTIFYYDRVNCILYKKTRDDLKKYIIKYNKTSNDRAVTDAIHKEKMIFESTIYSIKEFLKNPYLTIEVQSNKNDVGRLIHYECSNN